MYVDSLGCFIHDMTVVQFKEQKVLQWSKHHHLTPVKTHTTKQIIYKLYTHTTLLMEETMLLKTLEFWKALWKLLTERYVQRAKRGTASKGKSITKILLECSKHPSTNTFWKKLFKPLRAFLRPKSCQMWHYPALTACYLLLIPLYLLLCLSPPHAINLYGLMVTQPLTAVLLKCRL